MGDPESEYIEQEISGGSSSSSEEPEVSADEESSSSTDDKMEMELCLVKKDECNSCSKRSVFGYRERESFDRIGSDECTCCFDGNTVVYDFLMWCKRRGIGNNIMYTLESPLPFIDVAMRLSKVTKREAMYAFNSDAKLKFVKSFVKDIVARCFGSNEVQPWEYLDVGCGSAMISRTISTELVSMCQCMDVADYRCTKRGHDDFEHFEKMDDDVVHYPSNGVKLVTCFDHLHHSQNPKKLVSSIYDVLSDDGIFIMGEFDCQTWKDAYALDFRHYVMGITFYKHIKNVTEYRSKEGWREMITSCGFKLLEEEMWPPYEIYRSYIDVYIKMK